MALQYADKLFIQQKVDLLEAVAQTAGGCSCCEQANTYMIYDGNKPPEERKLNGPAHLFTIKEESHKIQDDPMDFCCRCCCNPYHPMRLNMFDKKKNNQVVFTVDRPFKGCGCACCPCCLQEWNVMPSVDGQPVPKDGAQPALLGSVTQDLFAGCLCPKMNLILGPDNQADPFWHLVGDHCMGELCCEVEFRAKDAKNPDTQVGTITKVVGDAKQACLEAVTDADNFEFSFQPGATVEQKAVALTGMIMIDYYFFESGGAFGCNPMANPGEECCHLNLCSQYCCGLKQTWACTCNKEDPEGGE